MAIGTNDLIEKFGTADTITTGTPSAISSATFSVAADVAVWTNDENAPLANFRLTCQWATVTSVANKRIVIYARLMNIDGTTDAIAPSTNRKWAPIGSFNVYAASTATNYLFDSGLCELPGMQDSQEYEFYLENLTGQTISSGWSLVIRPMTHGPAP